MMYDVKVTVGPVAPARWQVICNDCSGAIDSLVELLQGRFSKAVMTRLCEEKTGLFPSPKDILFTCSCPDWASMCKHVAAVLYGIGARLDHQPELLFRLRQVDQQDLIAKAGSALSTTPKAPPGARVLESDDLAGMFGIEMAPAPSPRTAGSVAATPSVAAAAAPSSTQTRVTRRAKPTTPAVTPGVRKFSLARRRAVSARMKKYWAERRASRNKPKAS
jgi:uncharacterized Zn finger protein